MADNTVDGVAVGGLVVGIIFTCVVAFFLNVLVPHSFNYKKGQLDAINGAVHYKLEKQLDGTTDWEYHSEIVK